MIQEKVANRERIFGTHLSMGNYWIADIFGMAGLDFVWIDTEHSNIDYDAMLECITILKAHDTAVFVRTQLNEYNHTKRLLEMGVDGIIFPMVESAEQAKTCLSYTFYPPKGCRGFAPSRAVRYGFDSADEYYRKQGNLCRFIQIESIKAVDALEQIVQDPDIDGFIFGPCDMALSAGCGTDVWNEKSMAYIKKAIDILSAHNKFMGVSIGSCARADQERWLSMGVHMISTGGDGGYIMRGVTENAAQMRQLISEYNNK